MAHSIAFRPIRLLVAVLAFLLPMTGCQPLPHPFANDVPRRGAPILALRDSSSVAIAPIEGLPRATAEKLGPAMAHALQAKEVAASDRTASLGSYELVGRIEDRRVVTYGENPQADVRLLDVQLEGGVCRFNILMRDRKTTNAIYLEDLVLPMPGHHNALNATAAIAVAYQLGMSADAIRKALAGFSGVKRRFTRTGEWNGAIVFDDYGHHPVEIGAVLKAARASTKGQVIAIVQPHRYTRLQSLFDQFATCFNDADAVIVADVYPAGEAPIAGIDRDHLVTAIKAHGHRQVLGLQGPEELPRVVRDIVRPGDYVLCLGAGSITQWAYALPGQLAIGEGA